MERYMNTNGDSGSLNYKIGDDYIVVQFKTGAVYTYTYVSASKEKVKVHAILFFKSS